MPSLVSQKSNHDCTLINGRRTRTLILRLFAKPLRFYSTARLDAMGVCLPNCPSCGSRSIKKSSAAYEQGVSYGRSTSSGVYVTARGRIGYRTGKGSSQRVSAVAQRNAPPQNTAPGAAGAFVWLVIAVIGISGGGGLLWPVAIGFVGAIVAASVVANQTQASFAARQAAYERQWYCRTCGSMFQI